MNISHNSDQKKGKKDFLYSIPIGSKPKGQTSIYRNPSQKDGLLQIPPQVKSLSDLWDQNVNKFSQHLLIEDYSYKQVDKLAKRVGSWIVSRGHKLFFLYSTNSPNWTITDIATWNYGLVNIPLYNTLGDEAFRYILQTTQGTLLFTTANLADNLYKFIKDKIYSLKEICFLDGCTNEQQNKFQNVGLKVSNFKDALDYHIILDRPDMNLLTQISYIFTSGTTGIPKGAIYTHKMIISQFIGVRSTIWLQENDVWLSYLPIAHCFQRFAIWACIYIGANIRYARHSIFQILKDLATFRPTRMTIVPRLLNIFYPILKALYLKQGKHDKARSMFGGRLKSIATGSASVSSDILLFFCQALNVNLGEGYGLTQSTAVSFGTFVGDINYGHVGGPNSVTQFKLVDVLDLNYSTNDELPRGQIYMRGPSMIKKYFKDQKNTAQTIDEDGWVHTGDIGVILPNGALKIIDRKKNIYKLQQAEYIAPQKIQNIYKRCKYVADIFLYGDSLKKYNVAIIHPNPEILPDLAQNLGIQDKDIKNLCQNKKINQIILSQIQKQGDQCGLHDFEQARVIKLIHQPFIKLGILTTTMKIQRHIAKEKLKDQITQLYK